MKVIPKFQTGGFVNYFTTYQPVLVPKADTGATTSGSSSSAKSSKKSSSDDDDTKGKLTEKDFFNMIKDINGLPNEMTAIVSNLTRTFLLQNIMGLDTNDLATTYLKNLLLIKIAALNKDRYDEAWKNAATNGSMAEPAIALNGDLMVQTKDGKLTNVNLATYYANRDLLTPLSVSLLLNLRAHSSSTNWDLRIFNIVNNSVGFEEFLTLIDKAQISLGSSSKSETTPMGREALLGLLAFKSMSKELLEQALAGYPEEGLYNLTVELKSNFDLVNAFVNYLNKALPKRVKTWAAIKLGIADTDRAADLLIRYYLSGKLSDSTTVKVSYSEPSKSSSDKSKSKENLGLGDIKMSVAAKWLAGYGDSETININIGDQNSILARTNTLPLVKMNGDYIGPNSTLLQAVSGLFGSVLDLSNVSIGMANVDSSSFNKVILTDGKISSVDYPCIIVDGKIYPDLSPETREKKNKADAIIKKLGIDITNQSLVAQNYLTINKIYLDQGLEAPYLSDGSISASTWKRFGVINATVDGNTLGSGSKSLVHEITDDAKADNIVQILKEYNKDYSFSKGIAGFWADSLYEGTIWIPARVDYVSATAYQEQDASEALALDTATLALHALLRLTGRQPGQ